MTTEQPQVNDRTAPVTAPAAPTGAGAAQAGATQAGAGAAASESDDTAASATRPASPADATPPRTWRRWFRLRRGSAARAAESTGAADVASALAGPTTTGPVPVVTRPARPGALVRAAGPLAHAAGAADATKAVAESAATSTAPTPPGTTAPAGTPGTTAPAQPSADTKPADGSKPGRKRLPSTRPPGSPPDPWTAFASTADRTPGRIRRGLRLVGRAVIHEYTLVILISMAIAVLMTWPTLRYPLYTLVHDTGGPAQQAWQIAWSGHILLTDPAQLWQSNAFFGERYSLAFSDSLLGYAPLGMIGTGPMAAVLRYNIIFVLAYALLLIGGYALVRQLGAGRTGAAVAAMTFAFAPWRLAEAGDLHLISVGAIPLALAMLARGHGWSLRHGLRSDRRHAGWAFAGWLVATWQLTLAITVAVPFAYVVAIAIVLTALAFLVRRVRRVPLPRFSWRLFAADLFGSLLFAAAGTALAVPHLIVARLYPDSVPDRAELTFRSPPVQSFLIGPPESRIWGDLHAVPRGSPAWPAEMSLLPGFTLYALALAGLLFSVWTLRQRLLLLVGVLLAGILTTGTQFFGGRWTYLPLVDHLPGWDSLPAPGRLILWTTLLLAVLAGGAVSDFVRRAEQLAAQRVPPWPGPGLRLATMVPVLLVAVEGLNVTPHPTVPAQPTALRTIGGPTLVLPTGPLDDQHTLLWTTSRFQPVANGSAAFVPQRQQDLRRVTTSFPDAASIDYLRTRGITTVVLLRDRVAGTPWERAGDIPVDTLGIQREDVDDTVVFRLQGP